MLRNASLLTGSAAVAQAIQMASLLFLTTIYPPAAFGDLAVASNTSAIVAVLVGLQLPFAIPVAKDLRQQSSILAVLRLNTIAAVFLSCLFIILWRDPYAFALLIGAAVCLGNTMKALAIAAQRPRTIAAYYFFRAAWIIGFQVALARFGMIGLVSGLALGEMAASAMLAFFIRPTIGAAVFPGVRSYLSTLTDFRSFTIFGVAQEAVAILVVLIPFWVADRLFISSDVGNFGMAYRFTWGPVAIVSTNVGWLVLGALGRQDRRAEGLLRDWRTSALLLLSVIFAVAGVAAILSATKRIHSFGEWSLAVALVPFLAAASLTFLASSPFRQIIRARGRQGVQFVIDAVTCAALLGAALVSPGPIVHWIGTASIIVVFQNVVTILYGRKLV